MKMSPFSAPFSWGTQKRGLLLPKRAAALSEGTQWCKGGTGKAEAAKLPDAGISLEQCPGKSVEEKGSPTELSRNRVTGRPTGAIGTARIVWRTAVVLCLSLARRMHGRCLRTVGAEKTTPEGGARGGAEI